MPRNRTYTFILAPLVLAWAASAGDALPTKQQELTIEVFSDFQCPYCRMLAPAIREAQAKGIDSAQATVLFKSFPLDFHADSRLAHQAALAAKEQGKFWEMHDLLFSNQNSLKRESLLGYAQKLGLDMARFRADLDSDRIKQMIDSDKAEGTKRGVQGTPTFFVNGKEHSGTVTLAELTKLATDETNRAWALSEISDAMMSRGPSNAPVTVEFFADLESPVSAPAMIVLNELTSRFPSAVRVQFRNFPLAFHPQAGMAHAAAMVAARQGYFWDFAIYILDHQDSLREQDLIAYAGKLGIDETKFAEMLHDRRYTSRVDADLAAGLSRGIRGSPVIFVNGKRIDGVPSLQTLTECVEAELAKK